MVSFQRFVELTEAKSAETGEKKLAVFAFGRFNPPTRGHKKLVDAVIEVANKRGGDPYIMTSHSHDPEKNPLDYDTKVAFMRELFSYANIVHDGEGGAVTEEIKNIFNAVGFLNNMGYTDVILVAGSDRVPEYQKRFSKSEEFYDSFEVVSSGERDPDAEGTSGMSGTKAREAAASGDVGKFRAATGWEGEVARRLMAAVRAGMGVE